MGNERKQNHKYLTSTVHSFQTSKEHSCEKTEKFYRRMQKQIHDNGNYIVPILLSVTSCYGHDQLEQYFRLVTDSQPNHIKNCMYISNNESGEVYRNMDVIKLKNCIGKYENKFTNR
jgi:hypothetical protein